MKTNPTSDLKQYARVARTTPRISQNTTNAKIKEVISNIKKVVTKNGQI